MWLVAGLGNPGSKYSRTRHNVGFMVLDGMAENHRLEWRERPDYRIASLRVDGDEVLLVEPLTYMNRSGTAVRSVMGKFSVPSDRLIVVHDDLDLETGRLRIRKKGSSGGHRGLASIIQSIGTKDFMRVKIGIGRDEAMPAEVYVLQKFGKEEIPLIREAVCNAADAVVAIVAEGPDKTMNRFNPR